MEVEWIFHTEGEVSTIERSDSWIAMRNQGVKTDLFEELSEAIAEILGVEVGDIRLSAVLKQFARLLSKISSSAEIHQKIGITGRLSDDSELEEVLGQHYELIGLEGLLRFVLPEIVLDVPRAMKELAGVSIKKSIARLINAHHAALYDGVLNPENKVLEKSVVELAIPNHVFTPSNELVVLVRKLKKAFEDTRLLEIVLASLRASSVRFKRNEISEKLFHEIRKHDPLKIYDALHPEGNWDAIKLEGYWAYDVVLSSTNPWNENNHLVFVNSSSHFIHRFLADPALADTKATFVLSDETLIAFAKTESNNRKRGGLVSFLSHAEMKVIENMGNRGPAATRLVLNNHAGATPQCISSQIVTWEPWLATNARVYCFASVPKKEIHTFTDKKKLMNNGTMALSISGNPSPKAERCFIITCAQAEKMGVQGNSEPRLYLYKISQTRNQMVLEYLPKKTALSVVLGSKAEKQARVVQQLDGENSTGNVERLDYFKGIDLNMRKIWEENDELVRVCVFCRGPAVPRSRKYRGMKRGKIIPGTEKYKNVTDISEAYKWAREEYPYFVRYLVVDAYQQHGAIARDTMTVRTYNYLNPETEDKLSNRKKAALRSLMAGETGHIRLAECTAKRIAESIWKQHPEAEETEIKDMLRLMEHVLDHAVKAGCTDGNPLESWIMDIEGILKRQRQAKPAVGKNVLTTREIGRLMLLLKEKLSNPLYLGVYIQLLTGLPANVICGLTIGAACYHPNANVVVLGLVQQMGADGELVPFREAREYIWFPCARALGIALVNHVRTLSGVWPVNERLCESLLLSYPAKGVDAEDAKHVTPKELRALVQKLLKDIGIKPHVIMLPDEGAGPKVIDINKFDGEILVSNFDHYMRRVHDMPLGMLEYLERKTKSLDKDEHYVGYGNPFNLLEMFKIVDQYGDSLERLYMTAKRANLD